jgi:hypothetical protein
MGSYFSKQSPSPQKVATDRVIPLHFWDDNKMLRPIVPEVTLRFDDALEIPKIRDALEKLLSRDGWNKLGARTRLRPKVNI